MRPLSRRALDLLDAIRADERGSMREWRDALRWSTTSQVEYYIKQLEAAGKITRRPHCARSVELTG